MTKEKGFRPDDQKPAEDASWELDDFAGDPDDQGLSLEDLSAAYADLLGKGHDPYQSAPESSARSEADDPVEEDRRVLEEASAEAGADPCDISPRTIVEAMLFVGHPNNEPLTPSQIAGLMRGVRPEEVEEIVSELNAAYREEGCAYHVVSEGAGYRMALRDEFRSLRDKFYGRVKEARLSQAAIDVLAVIAYNQPVAREDLDRLRDKESGAILNQLVRRGLLRVERAQEPPHHKLYSTTDRFLELFGLGSLDDLPRTHDLEPR